MQVAPQAQVPVSPSDEQLWSVLSWVLPFVAGFVGPLVIYLIYKDRSYRIRRHASEALNLQIVLFAAGVIVVGSIMVSMLLAAKYSIFGFAFAALFLLWFVIVSLGLVAQVFGIVKAAQNEDYTVPLIPHFVK